MEKKNELAKEERTIFIVLAIIVLIAIGVLVIWYFTKDKNLEDKDTDTKNKTVDTTKKEEDDNSSNSTYTFVPKDNEPEDVVVISDDVNQQEEVEIVDVAQVAKEEEQTVIKSQTYNYNTPYYLANENIDFSNIETKDETGEIVNVVEGTIIGVKGYKLENLAEEIVDVTGKYEITGNNSVTFFAEGTYGVLVMDSDMKVHEVYIIVYNDNDFNLLVNTIIDSIELKPIQSYDADKYNAFTKALADFKNIDVNDINTRKSAYVSLMTLYSELLDTYNSNVEYGTGKNPNAEVKDPEVTYGTGGEKEDKTEEEPKIEYGTGKNPNVQTLEEPKVEYGTGKRQQENEEEPTIIYGTGVQQI